MTSRSIPVVVDQHAEEAAFLWLLRSQAVSQPRHDLPSLVELDGRLEAHLDGLRIAGDGGWAVVEESLGAGEAGEVFVAALLALEQQDAVRLQKAIDASAEPSKAAGLISALGWVDWEKARGPASELLRSPEPLLRALGIRAYAVSRQHPGPALEAALGAKEPLAAAAAARAAGELGRVELVPALEWHLAGDDAAVRQWAAWSGSLLGSERSAELLASIAEQGGPEGDAMAATAARAMTPPQRRAWFDRLVGAGQARLAAIVAGAGGEPASMPWLLEAMGAEATARVAGAAFTSITGIDLAQHDLEGNPPEGHEEGPNDDPEDEDVEMSPDAELPWPEPRLVSGWWARSGAELAASRRYLGGKPISKEGLQLALRQARQRLRLAAAEELKLLSPGEVLFECRAAGPEQQGKLGASAGG